MVKLSRLTSLLLLVVLLLPASLLFPVHGVKGIDLLPVVYVNGPTGSDGYYGDVPIYTSGLHGPKKTIASGIAAVSTSGTVSVAVGIYTEHGLHMSETMNLVGEGALTTIIDGNVPGEGSGLVLKISSAPTQNNTVSGFTIRNGAPNSNEGDAGGGIYISSQHTVTIKDCAIIDNSKGTVGDDYLPGWGGGVCNDGGALYMDNCTVSGNTAVNGGGGIADITNFAGGGFGVMRLTNCTISGNTVTADYAAGGGIYCSNEADARLVNVTIADNHATGEHSFGGGFSNSSPTSFHFKNCIVAGNTAGDGVHNNGFDLFNGEGVHSEGYNIDSENSCYFNQDSDKHDTNPQLYPLRNNGGPTSTHAIDINSPAYNAGTSDGAPLTDQRGEARPQMGLFDIGAFEFVPAAPSVSTVAAGGIGTTTATLNGNLTDNGTAPSVALSFEYGLTTSYGSTVAGVPPTTSTAPQAFSAGINGLTPDTTYHFLAMADGGAHGASNGADMTFTTALPPPPPGPQFTGVGTGITGGSSGSMSSLISTTQTMVNPTFIIQGASLSALQAAAGEPLTVTATVANTSTVNGITKVRLYVNGQIESEKGVTVASGQQVPIRFDILRSEPGTYKVYVNSTPAGSFTIEAVDNSEILLFASIASILLSLVLGSVYLVRRRSY